MPLTTEVTAQMPKGPELNGNGPGIPHVEVPQSPAVSLGNEINTGADKDPASAFSKLVEDNQDILGDLPKVESPAPDATAAPESAAPTTETTVQATLGGDFESVARTDIHDDLHEENVDVSKTVGNVIPDSDVQSAPESNEPVNYGYLGKAYDGKAYTADNLWDTPPGFLPPEAFNNEAFMKAYNERQAATRTPIGASTEATPTTPSNTTESASSQASVPSADAAEPRKQRSADNSPINMSTDNPNRPRENGPINMSTDNTGGVQEQREVNGQTADNIPPAQKVENGANTSTDSQPPTDRTARKQEVQTRIEELRTKKVLTADEVRELSNLGQELTTLNMDPEAAFQAAFDKAARGEALTPAEQAALTREGSNEKQLTPEQQAEKVMKEIEDIHKQFIDKLIKGEDATEEMTALGKKLNEAHGVRQTLDQEAMSRDFVKGIFDKENKNPLSAKESEKRQAIREKLQELAQLQMQLIQARETMKALKKQDRAKEAEVKDAESKLNNPKDTPQEQYQHQMDWSTKTLQLAQIQEQIVRTRNLGKIVKSKMLTTKSYVHRRLGMNNLVSQVSEFMYASAYGAYANVAADFDMDF